MLDYEQIAILSIYLFHANIKGARFYSDFNWLFIKLITAASIFLISASTVQYLRLCKYHHVVDASVDWSVFQLRETSSLLSLSLMLRNFLRSWSHSKKRLSCHLCSLNQVTWLIERDRFASPKICYAVFLLFLSRIFIFLNTLSHCSAVLLWSHRHHFHPPSKLIP